MSTENDEIWFHTEPEISDHKPTRECFTIPCTPLERDMAQAKQELQNLRKYVRVLNRSQLGTLAAVLLLAVTAVLESVT